MEVREASAAYQVGSAYKQTEVGLIPNDWELLSIEEFTTTSSGTTPPRAQSERYFANGDIPWVKTLDLNNGVIRKTDECVTSAALKETCLQIFPAETVVVAMYGGYAQIGRTGILAIPATVNQALTAIRPNPERIDSRYLLYVLNFKVDYWKSVASSSRKDPNITGKDVKAFLLPLPSIEEQRAIASALSDADALIEALEELLAKKRQIKQGAMQELLTGHRRLPGFAGKWKKARLGDCATLKARIGWQGLTTAEYKETGEFYLVTGTEFKAGYIDWQNCFFVEEARYKQDKNIQLRLHDVVVTKDGTIGKVALINELPQPATLNSGVFVIRPIGDAFYPEFFYYLLCSKVFEDFLAQLSAGSTINHLYQKDFVGFEFHLPKTIEEQTAIATVLADIDADIAALEAKLAKARDLKQGMMQQLLTGRIRLV